MQMSTRRYIGKVHCNLAVTSPDPVSSPFVCAPSTGGMPLLAENTTTTLRSRPNGRERRHHRPRGRPPRWSLRKEEVQRGLLQVHRQEERRHYQAAHGTRLLRKDREEGRGEGEAARSPGEAGAEGLSCQRGQSPSRGRRRHRFALLRRMEAMSPPCRSAPDAIAASTSARRRRPEFSYGRICRTHRQVHRALRGVPLPFDSHTHSGPRREVRRATGH